MAYVKGKIHQFDLNSLLTAYAIIAYDNAVKYYYERRKQHGIQKIYS